MTTKELNNISKNTLRAIVGDDYREIQNLRLEALRNIRAAGEFESHGYTTFSHLREIGWGKMESLANHITQNYQTV